MRSNNQAFLILFASLALTHSEAKFYSKASLWGTRLPRSPIQASLSEQYLDPLLEIDTKRISEYEFLRSALIIRGGEIEEEEEENDSDTSSDDEDESSDEYDEEEENDSDSDADVDAETETDTDEYDSESEEEEEEEQVYSKTPSLSKSVKNKSKSKSKDVVYDEPVSLSPFQDMGVTLGVMLLCNKLDLTDKKIIKYARFAFIAYVVAAQIFLFYVRYKAHTINDRTPITITNPLSSLLQKQLPQEGNTGGAGDMVKNIANQFLASTSTIMEYDLSQAKSMNNGLLVPMIMLWVLHFKMGQVQPLFFQTASGVKELVFSPLFQTYILGKNLERPFKNKRMEEMQKQQEELNATSDDTAEVEKQEDAVDDNVDGDSSDDDDESDDDESDESDEEDDDEEYDEEYDEYN